MNPSESGASLGGTPLRTTEPLRVFVQSGWGRGKQRRRSLLISEGNSCPNEAVRPVRRLVALPLRIGCDLWRIAPNGESAIGVYLYSPSIILISPFSSKTESKDLD